MVAQCDFRSSRVSEVSVLIVRGNPGSLRSLLVRFHECCEDATAMLLFNFVSHYRLAQGFLLAHAASTCLTRGLQSKSVRTPGRISRRPRRQHFALRDAKGVAGTFASILHLLYPKAAHMQILAGHCGRVARERAEIDG